MKDILILRDEIADLEHATASFNLTLNIVTIHFKLDNVTGYITLEPSGGNQQTLKNKLAAVGRTQLGGHKPKDFHQIAKIMDRGISQRSIRILLNGLDIRAVSYGQIEWRASPKGR